MASLTHRRPSSTPMPSAVLVSPFLADHAAAPSFGGRFQLSAPSFLGGAHSPRAGTGMGMGSSAPAPAPATAGLGSSFGLQSPGGFGSGFDNSGWKSGWGASASASAAPGSARQPFGQQQLSSGSSGLYSTPKSAPYGQFGSDEPTTPAPASALSYPPHLHTPSYTAVATPGPSAASVPSSRATPSAAAAPAPTATTVPLLTPHPAASAAKFTHPDLEAIAHKLNLVAQHKTPAALALSVTALGSGVLLLLYIFLVPLPPSVPILYGLLSFSRDLVHSLGFGLALLLALVGFTGLRRYCTLEAPLEELEGLSERQRELMGWGRGAGRRGGQHQQQHAGSLVQGRTQAQLTDASQERGPDRNALRARARVLQLTGAHATPAPAASSMRTPIRPTASPHHGQHARSPVPNASLRFMGTPFEQREQSQRVLRSGGGGGGGGADRRSPATGGKGIRDEASLTSWAQEYEEQRAATKQHAGTGGMDTSFSASTNPFTTPSHGRSLSGLSPRSGGGGGFGLFGSGGGGFGSPFGSGVPATPPYATSSREALQQPKSGLGGALSFASSPFGSGGSSLSAGLAGVGGALGSGMHTFSFLLPGHRFPLDDPRSDADLHDSFHAQFHPQQQQQQHQMLQQRSMHGSSSSGSGSGGSVRLTPAVVDGWARSVRQWLVQQVLRPVLSALDQSNRSLSQLSSFVLTQAGVESVFRPEELLLLRELAQALPSQVAVSHASTAPLLLNARCMEAISLLVARLPGRPEVAQRIPLDKYLEVDLESSEPAPPSAAAAAAAGLFGSAAATPVQPPTQVSPATRAYVLARLHALCPPGDDLLSKFQLAGNAGPAGLGSGAGMGMGMGLGRNNLSSFRGGGGPFGSRTRVADVMSMASPASSAQAPSDAHLVFHAFCTYMESIQPGFRAQYIKEYRQGGSMTHARMPAQSAGASATLLETCALAQVRPPSTAPYFVVTHAQMGGSGAAGGRREAVKYVTEPGRASLFQALVLWAHELPRGAPISREMAPVLQR